MIFPFHRLFSMRSLLRWFLRLRRLFLFVVFLPLLCYSDCEACCSWTEQNEGQTETYTPRNNCVRMNPDYCEGVKQTIDDSISSGQVSLDQAILQVDSSIRSSLLSVSSLVDSRLTAAITNLNNALAFDSSLSDSLSLAISRLNDCISWNNDSVRFLQSVGIGRVFITNLASGATLTTTPVSNPFNRVRGLTNRLNDVSIYLQDSQSTNSQIEAILIGTISSLTETAALVADEITAAQNTIDLAVQYIESAQQAFSSASVATASINCAPCGSGSSSGGSGSGNGGTPLIDLTPVINAINAHRSQAHDDIDALKSLVYDFYSDYNSVRTAYPSSGPITESIYRTVGANWFKRMETLLYAVASPSFGNDSIDDYSPDEASGISSLMEDNDNKSSVASNEVNSASVDRQASVLYRLKHCVEGLYGSFSFLRVSSASVSGGFGDGGISVGDFHLDPLYIDSNVATSLDFIIQLVRYCFQAFYYIAAVLSLLGFFLLCFRAVRKCVELQLQLYASLFGS